MARTKKYNENMGELVDALSDFRSAETTIRAKYAALAEKEILLKRKRVLDLMFIKHHDSGPSEIANTTGLSRTTVIRWRKEFVENASEQEDVQFAPLSEAEIAENDALIADGDFTEEEVYGVGGKANQAHLHDYAFSIERSTESNADFHRIHNKTEDDVIYVIFGNMYGRGATANEADYNQVERPDWLTDEVLQAAEAETDLPIPGADWR